MTGATDDRRLQATLAPVRDSRGRPLYLFLQVQDVTAAAGGRGGACAAARSGSGCWSRRSQDYAIFMLDPTGHIVSWNAGAQRSKGYRAEEIIGQHFRVFYPPEQQERRAPRARAASWPCATATTRRRAGGSARTAPGSGPTSLITAVFNDAGEHIGFAKVTRDTTERQRALEARDRAAQALAAANTELESLNRAAPAGRGRPVAVPGGDRARAAHARSGCSSGSADLLAQHWSQLDRRGARRSCSRP